MILQVDLLILPPQLFSPACIWEPESEQRYALPAFFMGIYPVQLKFIRNLQVDGMTKTKSHPVSQNVKNQSQFLKVFSHFFFFFEGVPTVLLLSLI